MQGGRKRIEDFMQRYGLRVLAVAVAILLVLRARRVLRAAPRAIGAMGAIGIILLVGGGLLLASGMVPERNGANFPIPGPADGPVVKNGVAVIMACGQHRRWGVVERVESVPDLDVGTWVPERRGDCNVYYHYRPHGD